MDVDGENIVLTIDEEQKIFQHLFPFLKRILMQRRGSCGNRRGCRRCGFSNILEVAGFARFQKVFYCEAVQNVRRY